MTLTSVGLGCQVGQSLGNFLLLFPFSDPKLFSNENIVFDDTKEFDDPQAYMQKAGDC